MNIVITSSPSDFLARAGSFLVQHEAANNLMLGIARNAAGYRSGGDSVELLSALVEEEETVVGAAVMTPSMPLVLSDCPEDVLAPLAETLERKGWPVTGVVAPTDVGQAFAGAFCRVNPRLTHHVKNRMRIYQIDEVRFPERPPAGRMRVAGPSDLQVAIEYAEGFYRTAHDDLYDVETLVQKAIAEARLFFWETDHPVCLAVWVRDTPRGKAIGLVYTPEPERRRGYASALVAAVSRRALDQGKTHCALFADCDNPTSNHIYQELGYYQVGESIFLLFEPLPL